MAPSSVKDKPISRRHYMIPFAIIIVSFLMAMALSGPTYLHAPGSNRHRTWTVDVCVGRLRKKIEGDLS
ncbi:MAG: hypothetical protein AB1576_08360 [Bacillota bacterium]